MDNASNASSEKSRAKTDRRVIRTRRAIREAFDHLLAEKSIDKITVSAIAREADIDRKTFYLHYATIDDLVLDVAAQNIRDVEAMLERDGAGKTPAECVHLILKMINETITSDLEKYEHVASSLSIDQLLERVDQNAGYLLENTRIAKSIRTPSDSSMHLHMIVRFCLAGALSLYTEWLASDHTASIEEVSEIIEIALTTNLFGIQPAS